MPVLRNLFLSFALGAVALAAQAETVARILPDDIQSALAVGDYATAREALAPLTEDPDATEARYQYAQLLLNGLGGAVERVRALELLDAAAAHRHPGAATLLARVYLTGSASGVSRDPARAAALLRIAADQNVPEAQFYLGMLMKDGVGVPADPAAALDLLERSATGGYVEAQYILAQAYSRGDIVPPDTERALRWLTAAAEGGNTEAQFFLANALRTGEGSQQDTAAAFRWYRRAAEQNLPIAQRILGTAYMTGNAALQKNEQEAYRWLKSAADAGDPGAMFNLAIGLSREFETLTDDAQAASYLKAASDADLARATFMLAQFTESGRGVPEDLRAAALLYRTAFEQGDTRGAVRLGQLTGQGALEDMVPPHFSVPWTVAAAQQGDEGALNWLEAQAENGLRDAQVSYGLFLLDERKDARRAARFLEKAAQAGAPTAQHRLGVLYTTGAGVTLDYVLAHKWLNIAATNGIEHAAETREVIGNLMTPEQLAEAQGAARSFFENATVPDHVAGTTDR
ncbi:tetratricopeptide repeat protein [Tateyamaria omphalii]|uniref:Sel1 repeat family protein n=1 Tax=Tateyamaria omphalii TaxID=299262 RepID=A0A1P8N1W3_9RHOB|nr:tetratricopeptide repeat protein [Tateyamaria omphalii]APX14301.1 hypothetical protein BWR18_20870 [Tateyamaria omphalii]